MVITIRMPDSREQALSRMIGHTEGLDSGPMNRIAIIDFETSGLMPEAGGRATEVAVVLVEGGRIVDRFEGLMNAGVWIPPFITELTGISNEMVRAAPPAAQVMAEAARFVGAAPMVAHNASFDRKFWQSELARIGLQAPQPFACTVLLSRRLYPEAPNHKLGTLAEFHALPRNGRAHRALSDAEVTAELLLRMFSDLEHRHGIAAPGHELLRALQQCPKGALPRLLQRHATAIH